MARRKVLSVSAADCELQTFRAGGKGGQNQNKRDTGVRYIHHPSGARGEARDERSQLQNRRIAWLRLIGSDQFKLWMRRELGQSALRETETTSFEIMPEDIKIEARVGGRWTQVTEADLRADS